MQRPYQIASSLTFLFALFMGRESLRLKYYTELGPGPGFFPFWTSLLIGVLSVVIFFQATFRQSDAMPRDFFATRAGYLRTAAVLAALVTVGALMEDIGYRMTMLAFFLFLTFTLGRTPWIANVIISIAGSLGTFWLFNNVLMVPLPIGMLGF